MASTETAMAFDSSFLDELRARIGLAELIGRRVPLKRRGQEWTGLCPFHKEKTPSFTVNEAKGFYHCFGCGAHGSALDFVIAVEGLSFPEAVERLAREAGMAVPAPTPAARVEAERRRGLVELMEAAAKWFEAQLAAGIGAEARRYLAGRGLDPETIRHFRLGFAPDRREALLGDMQARGFSEAQLIEAGLVRRPEEGGDAYDFFRDRIIFPITERQGRIVAFGGRALHEARAKYLNSPETAIFQKGRMLYNLADARAAAHEAGTVIVAEGYMDVLALHRAGLAHAVAPLGTALSEEQLRALWRLAPEPVLCFDGDVAGRRAAQRAAERALPLLEPGRSLGFVELPAGQDPDSLLAESGAGALTELLAAPVPLVEMIWRHAASDRRLDTPERRAGLRRDLGDLVGRIRHEVVRGYYRQHLAQAMARLFGTEALPGPAYLQSGSGRGRRMPQRPLPAHRGMAGADAVARRRESQIFALLFNHPKLLEEGQIFEEFAAFEFASPILDRLHGLLIEHVGSRQALDVAVLKHDLTDSALRHVIDGLTGLAAAKVASFGEAKAEWQRISKVHQLARLQAEKEALQAALTEDMSNETWQRFEAVRTELERAKNEAAIGDGLGSEVPGHV